MERLTELAKFYGTDKAFYHSYTDFYAELFRGRTVRRLLEIGIGTKECMSHMGSGYKPGASLRMWRDYFPTAEIYGFDIDPSVLFREERIHTYLADYRNRDSLCWAMQQADALVFDIIIEDGFHDPWDQMYCANSMIPFLASGGTYVVEDVRAGARGMVQAGILYPSRVVEFDTARIPDDRLILVEL